MSEFNWYREDLAVAEQAPIAVYRNVSGNIAIRQKGDLNLETLEVEDPVIVVTPRHATELARAILALAEPLPVTPLALPAPADKTAAERQRRHRERKRHGDDTVTAVTVTPCVRNGADLFPD